MGCQRPESLQERVNAARSAAREGERHKRLDDLNKQYDELVKHRDALIMQLVEHQAEIKVLNKALETEETDLQSVRVAGIHDGESFQLHPCWPFPEGNDFGRKAPILPLMSWVQDSEVSLGVGRSPKDDESYHVFLAGDPMKHYSWQVFVTFNGFLIRLIANLKDEPTARKLYEKAKVSVKEGRFHAPEITDDAV